MKTNPTLFLYLPGLTRSLLETELLDCLHDSSGDKQTVELHRLYFSLNALPVASTVSAATGWWPDQHGILQGKELLRGSPPLQPVDASHRLRGAFWERLAQEGVSSISVGWPCALPGPQKETLSVADAHFGSPALTLRSQILKRSVETPAPLEALSECWVLPEEIPAPALHDLLGEETLAAMEKDGLLKELLALLAHAVSLQNAFLYFLDNRPWQVATLSLDLLATVHQLEQQALRAGKSFATGLTLKITPLVQAFLKNILGRRKENTNLVLGGIPWVQSVEAPGAILFQGPDFLSDQESASVSLVDLAPTVGHLAGYVETGMPGRAILELFTPERIENNQGFTRKWEPQPGKGPTIPETEFRQLLDPEILQDLPPDAKTQQSFERERDRILETSLLSREAHFEALPLLEKRVQSTPSDTDGLLLLALTLMRCGLYEEALDTAWEAVDFSPPDNPEPLMMVAMICAAGGDSSKAREFMEEADALPESPRSARQKLSTLRKLGDPKALLSFLETDSAEQVAPYRKAIAAAEAYYELGDYEEAAHQALEAISLEYSPPHSHEILGLAYEAQGKPEDALTAYSVCAVLAPTRSWPFRRLISAGTKAEFSSAQLEPWVKAVELAEGREEQLRENYRVSIQRYREEMKNDPEGVFFGVTTASAQRKPQSLFLVTGRFEYQVLKGLQRLEREGYPVSHSSAEEYRSFWLELAGDSLSTPLESNKIYYLPPALLPFLPPEHNYRVLFITGTGEDEQHPARENPRLKPLLELPQEERKRFLRKESYLLVESLRARPNVFLLEVSVEDLKHPFSSSIETFFSQHFHN